MTRQCILLLESDVWIKDMLCELFEEEDLNVTLCGSFAELEAGVAQHPQAVIVSDSWEYRDYLTLSPQHRAEIVALAKATEIVLTTGREWARDVRPDELGSVTIIGKPYDLNELTAAIHAALERVAIHARDNASEQAAGRGANSRVTHTLAILA